MLLTAELAALNLDPAQQEGVVAAVLPLHAEAEKLRAQAKLDTLKIQALTLELAHLRRIRFGVKNEALSPEQRDLFRETADADSAAIEAEVEQQQIGFPVHREGGAHAGRQRMDIVRVIGIVANKRDTRNGALFRQNPRQFVPDGGHRRAGILRIQRQHHDVLHPLRQ